LLDTQPELFPKKANDFGTDMNGQRTERASRVGEPEKAVLDRTRICFRTHSKPVSTL
jgi:hypothetical protein